TLSERGPNVSRRAYGGQDGAAATGRSGRSLEHLPSILPDRAASRVRLCPSFNEATAASSATHTSRLRAIAVSSIGAAAHPWHRCTVTGAIACFVASAAPPSGMRPSFVRHLGDRTIAAKLVY